MNQANMDTESLLETQVSLQAGGEHTILRWGKLTHKLIDAGSIHPAEPFIDSVAPSVEKARHREPNKCLLTQ